MVCILLGDGFEEIEALAPADLLRRAGLQVKLVSVGDKTVTGGQGIRVLADATLDELSVQQMQMLVVPGGRGGVNAIRNSYPAMGLIEQAWNEGCWIASICAGPTILAHLGLLDRRRAVCYPGLEDEMGSAVVVKGRGVVVDQRMVTAQAAGSAIAFGLKLIEVLLGPKQAQEVKHAIQY